MVKKQLLFLLLFLASGLTANASFNFDANCVEAYKAILSLRMNEARLLIQKEKQQSPQNGITILLDNYVDYFSLLASESKTDYDRLKDNKSARVSALEKNDENSPYYLYSQAEVYLQWGLIKAKFGDYFSSSIDIKKANNLLTDNAQKYPGFLPNQISIALVNVVFGSIPSNLKSVTHFLGMTGNAKSGIRQLEELRTELPKTKFGYYNNEVVFFLCTMDIGVLHNTGEYAKMISYLNGMESNSLLKVYLQGFVASKTGHNDEAIAFLEASPAAGQYINIPAISYMLANAKLNRMDEDSPVFFNKYLKEYRGTSLIKDAYLKLAYFYLLSHDAKKYDYYLKLVRTKGYAYDEKDQQALREANDARPDTDLLRARLYFDGGYYTKALAQIKSKDVNGFKVQRDKMEWYYRLGRIYEKTGQLNDALVNYQRTINLGKTTKYYYAANAALRIGNIYEQKRDFARAVNFYNQAIDMKDHEYENSIRNEAKAGLKRMDK